MIAYCHEEMLLPLYSMLIFLLSKVRYDQRLLNELKVFRAGVDIKQNSLFIWSVRDSPVHCAAHHSYDAVASTNDLNYFQEVSIFLVQ